MNVAIVGAGAAGLACARLLRDDVRVTLFESEPHLGGHARSLPIVVDGATVAAETGFKYLMWPSHRRTMAWLAMHGVAVRRFESSITLTFEAERTTLVLPPRRARDVGRLLMNPAKLPWILGIAVFRSFNRDVVENARWEPTLAGFSHPLLPRDFASRFAVPFFAANWGATSAVIGEFPLYDVVSVLPKGMVPLYDIASGASAYVRAVAAVLGGVEVRTGCPVTALRPDGAGVAVVSSRGVERFDRVILALPGQRAAPLLGAWPEWQEATGRFRTFPTHIVIHSDPAFMPEDPRDWSLINQFHRDGEAFVTEWCGWIERRPVFRTWLPAGRPMPANVHHACRFEHLVVTPESVAMQARIAALQGTGGLYAGAMYVTGFDIHESSLASALDVAASIAPASAGVRAFREAIAADRLPEVRRR